MTIQIENPPATVENKGWFSRALRFQKSRWFSRPRRGSATLEMALTATILFNICFGTIEFGYYFFVKNSMESGAREGCRAAIVSGAVQTDVTTAVLAQLKAAGLLASSAVATTPYTVTTTPTDITTATSGNNVTVTITGTWGTVGSGFRPMAIIGTAKVVSASCVMRKE